MRCAARGSEDGGVVALFEAHELFFHDLDVFGDLEEGFDDFGLGGVVAEILEERVHFHHGDADGVAVIAELLAGGGSFHAMQSSARGGVRQAWRLHGVRRAR